MAASLRQLSARPVVSAPRRARAPASRGAAVVTKAANIVETAKAAGTFKTLVAALEATGAFAPCVKTWCHLRQAPPSCLRAALPPPSGAG